MDANIFGICSVLLLVLYDERLEVKSMKSYAYVCAYALMLHAYWTFSISGPTGY